MPKSLHWSTVNRRIRILRERSLVGDIETVNNHAVEKKVEAVVNSAVPSVLFVRTASMESRRSHCSYNLHERVLSPPRLTGRSNPLLSVGYCALRFFKRQ